MSKRKPTKVVWLLEAGEGWLDLDYGSYETKKRAQAMLDHLRHRDSFYSGWRVVKFVRAEEK